MGSCRCFTIGLWFNYITITQKLNKTIVCWGNYIPQWTILHIMKNNRKDILKMAETEKKTTTTSKKATTTKKTDDKISALEKQNQELQDFLARRLYEMAATCVMSHLIIQDATQREDMFLRSAVVYINYAEAEIEKHFRYIQSYNAEQLSLYRQG